MIENYRMSDLPPYGKLFVGIFTALVLCVLLWVAFIYYVDKGMVDQSRLPAYLSQPNATQPGQPSRMMSPGDSIRADSLEQAQIGQDAEIVAEDSQAVLAPVWDKELAGREVHADSISAAERFEKVDSAIEREEEKYGTRPGTGYDYNPDSKSFDVDEFEEPDLRENVGLAHTHINGQTLLFFALGVVFLFTSVTPKVKKIVYWVFGIAILTHAIGLSGQRYHWFFDDILALSGVTIVVVIAYMAFLIFVDLGKKRKV